MTLPGYAAGQVIGCKENLPSSMANHHQFTQQQAQRGRFGHGQA